MVFRERHSSVLLLNSGSATWLGPGTASGGYPAFSRLSICKDTVDGTRDSHALEITHSHPLAYTITGRSHSTPGAGWSYGGYGVSILAPVLPAGSPEPSDNTSMSHALASTNPNRPNSDVLQAIVELKDIPAMLRSIWKRNLTRYPETSRLSWNRVKRDARSEASRFLEWQFGWLPMYRDLQAIVNFQANTEKKLRQLRNLRDRGSIGGSAVVWEDEVISSFNSYLTNLYIERNRRTFHWVTTRKKWVSTRWIPTVELPPQSDAGDEAIARRMAFGQGITPALIWELMPWSWLIDWFSNVGDLMSLTRNAIPVHHTGSCIMRRTTTRLRVGDVLAGSGSYSVLPPRSANYDRKERSRFDGVPLPEFNLPFLNGKQLGILSALTIGRTLR